MMPSTVSLSHSEHAANPLDVLEQIVAANDWVFDRRSDHEMAAEAPGKWCDYGLYFSWSREISAMHFTCAFDLKVPAARRSALYELLALANEKLWIGHFGMDSDDGMPLFRHSVLLRGAPGASAESLEDMVDIAITECERFFPAFQFVLWGGKAPAEALAAAMLAGWRKQGLAPSVVIDPAPGAAALAGGDVQVVTSAAGVPDGFTPAVIVLAVKPQMAAEAVPGIACFAGPALVVSIMAGRTVAGVQALTGAAAVVRAMPNTPAAIGRGFTAAFAAPGVAAEQQALCETLLTAIGEVAWVAAEAEIDAVTAVSGGGPAYVFLLTELLAAAAIEQGLPAALAWRMARATVSGSGALLAATDEDPAAMRRAVTSPAGTTERALAVLMAPDAWPAAMSRAIAAATARSRELSQ